MPLVGNRNHQIKWPRAVQPVMLQWIKPLSASLIWKCLRCEPWHGQKAGREVPCQPQRRQTWHISLPALTLFQERLSQSQCVLVTKALLISLGVLERIWWQLQPKTRGDVTELVTALTLDPNSTRFTHRWATWDSTQIITNPLDWSTRNAVPRCPAPSQVWHDEALDIQPGIQIKSPDSMFTDCRLNCGMEVPVLSSAAEAPVAFARLTADPILSTTSSSKLIAIVSDLDPKTETTKTRILWSSDLHQHLHRPPWHLIWAFKWVFSFDCVCFCKLTYILWTTSDQKSS